MSFPLPLLQEILAQTYSKSLLTFAEDLLKEHEHFEKPFRMEEALTKSFSRLDQDLSREALSRAANEGEWLGGIMAEWDDGANL